MFTSLASINIAFYAPYLSDFLWPIPLSLFSISYNFIVYSNEPNPSKEK